MKSSRDNVLQLPLNRLKSFPEFSFRVVDDKGMQQLVEGIRNVGVFTLVIVRSIDGWTWQVISGHKTTDSTSAHIQIYQRYFNLAYFSL